MKERQGETVRDIEREKEKGRREREGQTPGTSRKHLCPAVTEPTMPRLHVCVPNFHSLLEILSDFLLTAS